MNGRSSNLRGRSTRLALGVGITLTMAWAAAACGSGESAAPSGTGGGDAAATSAEIGEQLSRSQGCAGCHGSDFNGGAGPGWIGLAGSDVPLDDGTTVVADDVYLTAAIAEPALQIREGYNLRMPANNLDDEEIAHIVAYINSLADG